MTDPAPSSVPPPRRYSGGQIFMIVVGVILLLPGICSLFFFVVLSGDLFKSGGRDPYLEPVIVLWLICFAISAGGVALILWARKRARRTQ